MSKKKSPKRFIIKIIITDSRKDKASFDILRIVRGVELLARLSPPFGVGPGSVPNPGCDSPVSE